VQRRRTALGVASRASCSASDWRHVLESVPFGIIPGGSGNGLASSLGILDPAVAAAAICKGVARPVDLAAVRQRAADGAVTTWWSILMMTWGLIADCDIGSEHLRMLGGARFTVAGVQRIGKMHQYPGRVAILPARPTMLTVAATLRWSARAVPRVRHHAAHWRVLDSKAARQAAIVDCGRVVPLLRRRQRRRQSSTAVKSSSARRAAPLSTSCRVCRPISRLTNRPPAGRYFQSAIFSSSWP
jgi:hypothetical protein